MDGRFISRSSKYGLHVNENIFNKLHSGYVQIKSGCGGMWEEEMKMCLEGLELDPENVRSS